MTEEEFRAGLRAARAAWGTGEDDAADGSIAGLLWEARRRARPQHVQSESTPAHVSSSCASHTGWPEKPGTPQA